MGGRKMDEENIMQEETTQEEVVEQEEVKQEEVKQEEAKQEAEKKYTDKEVDKLIAKKYAKLKADAEKEVEEARAEAEKLAKMNATEKLEHEKTKLQEELEELRREKNLNLMKDEAIQMLEEKNISINSGLLSILVTDKADTTKENVENFVDLFNKAVDKEVTEKLKGPTPKKMGGGTITKEEIMKIKDPILRQSKIAENLELFD